MCSLIFYRTRKIIIFFYSLVESIYQINSSGSDVQNIENSKHCSYAENSDNLKKLSST